MPVSLAQNSPSQLLVTATSGSGIIWLAGNCNQLNVNLQSAGTTSGGVITIEEAYYPNPDTAYTGTWSVITTVNASAFTGGASVTVHIVGSFWAVRVRVSSAITGGGTVTADAWGS